MKTSSAATLFIMALIGTILCRAEEWHSTLYPADWKPGFADAQGHFLHDFSYAGYHRGEKTIPHPEDNLIDVTKEPYLADNTGSRDATAAIQSALDEANKKGGGVVFLPAGTYKVVPPDGATAALNIQGDHIVLRGAGTDKTFLYADTTQMRGKRIILVKSREAGKWLEGESSGTPVTAPGAPESILTQDLIKPALEVSVADVSLFAVGDLVVVRNDFTQHYIDLLGMTGKWTPAVTPNRTLAYYRRIVSIDAANKTLTFDIPVRGFLYTADNARVVKFTGRLITEVGVEDLSISMKQHPGGGLDDDEIKLTTPGTTSYEIAWSTALQLSYAENCWVRRVNSYCPPGNDPTVHIHSNGISVSRSRLCTIEDCDWKYPQFKGGGGNGYLYTVQGSDCLFKNCRAEQGRHNFSFGTMQATGNVLLECVSKDGRLSDDFHMFLSLANLIDNLTADGSAFDANFRPHAKPLHGVTTTQSVFWNINGLKYRPASTDYAGKTYQNKRVIISSHQFGDGYVIGTRGPASAVDTSNFSEGIGKSDTLLPRSLYRDQFQKRTGSAVP
jgi:hypothetical protein